jgi:hypothetical protein
MTTGKTKFVRLGKRQDDSSGGRFAIKKICEPPSF